MSGLPASGKSTVASAVAKDLALPLLDKDILLESLFGGAGIGDAQWRRKLSHEADHEMQKRAVKSKGAVLASWWKHPRSPVDSGTPTEWLSALPGSCVEVYCQCRPEVAAERFITRKRHPGHLDQRWSYADLVDHFSLQARLGPLRLGQVVRFATEQKFEAGSLLNDILNAFQEARKASGA